MQLTGSEIWDKPGVLLSDGNASWEKETSRIFPLAYYAYDLRKTLPERKINLDEPKEKRIERMRPRSWEALVPHEVPWKVVKRIIIPPGSSMPTSMKSDLSNRKLLKVDDGLTVVSDKSVTSPNYPRARRNAQMVYILVETENMHIRKTSRIQLRSYVDRIKGARLLETPRLPSSWNVVEIKDVDIDSIYSLVDDEILRKPGIEHACLLYERDWDMVSQAKSASPKLAQKQKQPRWIKRILEDPDVKRHLQETNENTERLRAEIQRRQKKR